MGDQVEWNFHAPATGYYKLGFRYKQSDVEGFFVSRRIELDGKVPFAELEAYKFPYTSGWSYAELGGSETFLFYLTEGPHTLTLTNVTGDTGEIVKSLQETVLNLNRVYRSILAVTGPSPDTYRDYYLDKELPECMEVFQQTRDKLNQIVADMEKLAGRTGGGRAF